MTTTATTLHQSIRDLLERANTVNALGSIQGPVYTTTGQVHWTLCNYRVNLTELVDLARKHYGPAATVALVPSFSGAGNDIRIIHPRSVRGRRCGGMLLVWLMLFAIAIAVYAPALWSRHRQYFPRMSVLGNHDEYQYVVD